MADEIIGAAYATCISLDRMQGRAVLLVGGGARGAAQALVVDLDGAANGGRSVREMLLSMLGQAPRRAAEAPAVGSSAQPVNIDVNLNLDGLRSREISKTRLTVERDRGGFITGATMDGASDARIEA